MASSPRASTVSRSSSTSTNHRQRQEGERTGNEAFIRAQLLPSSKDEHGHSSISPKGDITRTPVSPDDATSESIASLVGGFAAGVALAISHHVFLTFLNGRNINEYPQYWVKNANNAFSALFSICIAFVATCALIQMKWNVARSKPLSIRSIDNLFALPSPVALFTTVTSTRLRSLRLFLIPMLAAVFIQSVALVSVFAPNALTVAPSAETSQDILLNTLDLSTGPIMSLQDMEYLYDATSLTWTTELTSIMLYPPIFNWKIPPGCGATCNFDMVYEGPGLQCMDTPSEPPPITPPNNSPYYNSSSDPTYPLVYNATSTLYKNPGFTELAWEIAEQYELQIDYIATDDHGLNTGRDGGSVHCVFRNTTYKASFQVENNTMEANTMVQSYGDILGGVNYAYPCESNMTQPCFIYGANTRAICEVFASALTGQLYFNTTTLTEFSNVLEVTGGINVAVTDLLFSHSPDFLTYDFQLKVANLSESLVGLFSNLTLGLIPHRNNTRAVLAEIWDGSYAWSYTVWILWAVYLPTLLLASVLIFNGLLSIRSNKRGIDEKFSNMLLATRNTELDVLCINAEDFAEFQQFRLLYQSEKGNFSVASGEEYPK